MSPTRLRLPQPFKYFSLFSGIGGFELGIEQAYKSVQRGRCETSHSSNGMSVLGSRVEWGRGNQQSPLCIGFSEIDKYAVQTYKKYFNHKEYGNVSTINWSDTEDFNLLVGGFPCQAFSIAGKRQGFSDTRGTLFFEIARCLREKQPRLLLLENVKGLLSHDKGKTFGVILNTLDELGYDLQWQVLNSKNFGVPQNRERVFIVGHLRGIRRPEVFPIGQCYEIPKDPHKQSIKYTTFCGETITQNSRQVRTITANYGELTGQSSKIIDAFSIRRLTPTECERLQGFPDGWTEGVSNTQQYKCLGNAVTVNVIEAIMTKLLETL